MKNKKGLKFFNVWYIPHDKVWSKPNPSLYKEWMGVWAISIEHAKKIAREDGQISWIEEEKLAISK